mgnify:CR=1 FL=1
MVESGQESGHKLAELVARLPWEFWKSGFALWPVSGQESGQKSGYIPAGFWRVSYYLCPASIFIFLFYDFDLFKRACTFRNILDRFKLSR